MGLKTIINYHQSTKEQEQNYKLQKDHEMALALKEKENNLKWKLSHLTQRWVPEKFYQIFWEKLIEKQIIQKDQKQKRMTEIKRMTHQPMYRQ